MIIGLVLKGFKIVSNLSLIVCLQVNVEFTAHTTILALQNEAKCITPEHGPTTTFAPARCLANSFTGKSLKSSVPSKCPSGHFPFFPKHAIL